MEHKQVASKILAVMKDVEYVKKDGRNTSQSYNYVSEAGLLAKVRESMVKHGLIVTINVKSCETEGAGTTAGGAEKRFSQITAQYTIIDCDSGESLDCTMSGGGVDAGDKGIYKAITGMNKYFWLKLLQIPTGDDPEADESTDRGAATQGRREPPQQTQQAQQRPQEPPTEPSGDIKTFPSKYGTAEKPNACTFCGGYHIKQGDPLVGIVKAGADKKTYGHVDCYKSGLERG